jgi:dephospho-CoA kinase
MLEEYGIPVVSADELSRMVVAPGTEGLRDVVEAFGTEVLSDGVDLDRQKMGEIVFQDPGKRRQLESILHPRIRERYQHVLAALEEAGHEVVVYEVPLLFEKNLEGDMKGVILVSASDAHRIARVRARDHVTEADVRARMAAQMDEASKRKRAQYIIDNDGDFDDLRREVEYVLSRYLKIPTDVASSEPAPSPDPPPTPVGTDLTLPPPPEGGEEAVEQLTPESELDTLPPARPKTTARGKDGSGKKDPALLPAPQPTGRKQPPKTSDE